MSLSPPVVVCPVGRLDAAHSPQLDQELRGQIARGTRRVIVDLSQATYISSNGLRVLLGALRTLQSGGGDLKLCCLGARLQEIFEMAGFDQIFEIYDDRQAAEQALTSSKAS